MRKRILVVDEGRKSAGVGEGIITAIVEAGLGAKPLRRVVGADTFTPLAGAALLVLPGEADIVAAAKQLQAGDPLPGANREDRLPHDRGDHVVAGERTGRSD